MEIVEMHTRRGIAMIELIFALVIIGIVLMSAPRMIEVSTQSMSVALQQESIAAASSQISLVLTRNWDESDSNSTAGYGILSVISRADRNVSNFNMSRTYNVNAGFTQATPMGGGFGADATDGAIPDDIDDFAGTAQVLQLYAGETAAFSNNEGDYIDANGTFLNTAVAYGDDNASYTNTAITFNNPFQVSASNSSNIKLISVRLQTANVNKELAKDISLYAFSCNIGTPNIGVVVLP